MKRQRVQDAYKRIQPSEAKKKEMLQNILSAASALPPAERNIAMKRRKLKPVLIAAIIALMVLLMGCAVVALNLRDMKLGEVTYTYPRYIDENGEMVYSTEKTMDVISLQGVEGSPEYMAAQEWGAYERDMVLNHADEIINDFEAPEDYDAYLVGNQEMQDKIDEICAKYDLKLLGPMALCQMYEMDIFYDSLGIDSLIKPGAEAAMEKDDGYFYANGNFKLEFWLSLTGGEAQYSHEILMSFSIKHKGYFDTVFTTVADSDSADQWSYTLADGSVVLIVKSGGIAYIFCDREDAFLSAGFRIYDTSGQSNDVMTDRDIELVAEALNFAVMPQKPDMDAAKARLAESQTAYQAQQEAEMADLVDPYVKDSYRAYIEMLLADTDREYTYGFADLNGDGVEELLIGYGDAIQWGNCFSEALTIKDSKTAAYYDKSSPTYICEDNVLEYVDPTRTNWRCYEFLDTETGEYTNGMYLNYHEMDGVWVCGTHDKAWPEQISEEEAVEIISAHPRIDLEMKPITEYPMAE